MRILFVLASRGAGGAEILVRDLALELRQRGVEVGIAFISRVAELGGAAQFEPSYQAALDAASVATFDLGHACRRNPVLGARRLLSVIEGYGPDIVHIHLQFGLLFRLLLWPRRIPTVYTHHTDRFRQGRALFRLLSLVVDRHVAISSQTDRLLRREVGDRVVHIPNAVRFLPGQSAAPNPPAQSTFQVLTVGGLQPQKDHSTLVRTAARLIRERPDLAPGIRFLIAGEGPERVRLEQQIAASGLQSTVVLLGLRTDVHLLMAQSDLLLMTSVREGMPLTLLEALHAGLPIVATDVGGCSEAVEPGGNGFLAPPGDEAALARYVMMLFDDPDLRSRFSQRSTEKAGQFSIDANAEQHVALYRRVLQRGEH